MSILRPWQLAAPADDGEILLWPDPARWLELAGQNRDLLATERDVRLLDVPLAEVRRLAREQFASARPEEGEVDANALWFVTGHQTYPYHAGIWAKSVAIDAAARAAGQAAVAANLNVDHDLPHAGPQIAWPARGEDGRLVRRGALPLDHRQPFERQPAPSADKIRDLCQRIETDLSPIAVEPFTQNMEHCLVAMPQTCASDDNFASWFVRLRSSIDAEHRLDLHETTTSRLANQDAFLLFIADWLAQAASLFSIYNRAVTSAHAATGHSAARPLEVSAGRFELPFWTLRSDRVGRGRLFASDGQTLLLTDSVGAIGPIARSELRSAARALPALRRVLADAGIQIRPRALTLTLFARMFLADLFVHGIGGAIYDQATNTIIEQHMGLAATPFAVVSATLRLPLNVEVGSPDDLRRVRQVVRDMRHNPQRHMPANQQSLEPASTLLSARQSAIERNAALRNVVGPDPETRRRQRAALFHSIRQINRDLAGLIDDRIAAESARLRRLAESADAAEIVNARDYFYGLLPPGKLEALRSGIRSHF